jgi:hypothetical protein
MPLQAANPGAQRAPSRRGRGISIGSVACVRNALLVRAGRETPAGSLGSGIQIVAPPKRDEALNSGRIVESPVVTGEIIRNGCSGLHRVQVCEYP